MSNKPNQFIIEKMLSILVCNSKANKKIKGFPVVALLLDQHKKVMDIKVNERVSDETEDKKWSTHAERLLYEEHKEENLENCYLIISIPPCKHCLEKWINETNINPKNIIFLFKSKDKNYGYLNKEINQYDSKNKTKEINLINKIKKIFFGAKKTSKNSIL